MVRAEPALAGLRQGAGGAGAGALAEPVEQARAEPLAVRLEVAAVIPRSIEPHAGPRSRRNRSNDLQ
ncbi:hypothetical protein ABIE49_002636 [Bradyrhizobium sp. OAE829]